MRQHRGALAALCVFALIALGVATSDSVVGLDLRITAWFQSHTTPSLTRWVLPFTDANDPIAISIFGSALGLYFWWRGERLWLFRLAAVLPAGLLINVLLKQLFHRGRPSVAEPLLSLATYSFPSGHISGALLFYGLLAAFLASRPGAAGRRWAPWAPWLCAALMVLLVGLSRIYLGVHFFTDVVGAIAWSWAWLALWLSPASLRARCG